MSSEGSGLSVSDLGMLQFHLRNFSHLLLKSQDSVRGRHHSPQIELTRRQILITLQDIGMIAFDNTNHNNSKKENNFESRNQPFNTRTAPSEIL